MKKFIALLIVPFLFLVSCNKPKISEPNSKNENTASNKEVLNYTVKDFYPFKENVRLKYKGEGNEYADKDIYTDFIKENRIQIREVNPGTTSAKVVEIKDGELRLITTKSEFYYRDNIIDTANKEYEVLLKEPFKEGTSWNLPNGDKRYISSIDKEIEVPYGKYKAIEVTTEGKNYKNFDYYVKDIGLVKSLYSSDGMEVKSELEYVKDNVPVVQTVKFYHYNAATDKIVFVKNKLNFNTNDTVISQIEPYFKKSPAEELSPLINSDIKINKIFLDRSTNTVNVDFSDNFVKAMNVGGGVETSILTCITNTLCNYYNVDKAYITLGGKPYSSGHILLNEGETFKVDYNNISEYTKTK